jgi:hypothetical protein
MVKNACCFDGLTFDQLLQVFTENILFGETGWID